MEVEDFPVWVIDDCRGQDLYGRVVAPWRKADLLPEEFHVGERVARPGMASEARWATYPSDGVGACAASSNWREYDGSFGRKVRLTLRNRTRAVSC